MNIVNIIGGLGNQLFQNLFGETLSNRTGIKTAYSLSAFRSYKLHTGFAIEKTFDKKLEILCAKNDNYNIVANSHLLQRSVGKSPVLARLLGCETDRTFSLDYIDRANGQIFVGYWQSQPYSEQEIQNFAYGLQFESETVSAVDEAFMTLDFPGRVAAVHVRRGDFLAAPASAPHYALPADYYRSAMERVQRDAGVKHFIVVTDDPVWVRNEIEPYFPVATLPNPGVSALGFDLCMLAKAPHKVLSNSTFGWWGAHLSGQDGLVIAPSPWCKAIPNAALSTPPMSSRWTLMKVNEYH